MTDTNSYRKTTGEKADRESNGQFANGNSANPAGRPKGSKNKATRLREELLGPILPEAVKKLREAVLEGEKWAVEMAISYSLPKPKPIDTEEMAEIEQRIEQLELVARGH